MVALVSSLVTLRAFLWDEESRRRRKDLPATAPPACKEAVLCVHDLRKTYGTVRAVDGVSFEVRKGEIFGLLGPNGAGKTTTLEIVEGLRAADQGQIRLLGHNPLTEQNSLLQRVGIQLQEANLPSRLKVREIFALFAAFYERTLPAEHLLEMLDLREQANRFFGKLSGGQKQRVFAALALLNDPEVIFLDEITTGLDAHIRRSIWGFLRELRRQGKTIVLTTHYLEEAQALCDRVIMLNRGQIVAQGIPEELIEHLGMGFRLEVEVGDHKTISPETIQALPEISRWTQDNGTLTLYLRAVEDTERVLAALRSHGIPYRSLKVQSANLEDVFLVLTETQTQPEA
jgi:ABC-2 type transport system ATP-binding protein